jgi:hypothetical protein
MTVFIKSDFALSVPPVNLSSHKPSAINFPGSGIKIAGKTLKKLI